MRSLPFSAGVLSPNDIAYEDFVVITIPSPVSATIRYTTMGGGFVGNIDGAPATWTEPPGGLVVDGIEQSEQDINSMTTLEIGNLDSIFGDYIMAVGNCRTWPCSIYRAHYDDSGTLQGAVEMFTGELDASEIGDTVKLTVLPGQPPFALLLPRRASGPACKNQFKDSRTCQYVGVDTICLKTRHDCQNRTGGSNLVHWGGDDLAPKPNTTITWGLTNIALNDGRGFTTRGGNTTTTDNLQTTPPPPPTGYGTRYNDPLNSPRQTATISPVASPTAPVTGGR